MNSIIDFDFIFFTVIGKSGAMRYCSQNNFGNSCKLVDNKEFNEPFEQCIKTCNTDGCNV